MEVLEESGFCPSNGIYYSKWDSLPHTHSPTLSLPSFLFSLSPRTLGKPAFIEAETGATLTYAELQALTIATATALRALGVKQGDVVLLVSPNFLHFPLLVLAIMSIGAIFSTANPLNTRSEIQTQIQDSNPVLILTTLELQPKLEGLLARTLVLLQPFLDNLLGAPGIRAWEPSFDLAHVEIRQEDTAALMYSSGTTGKSKAVVCSHGNLIEMSSVLRHVWSKSGGVGGDVYMCVVPLFHMFGLSVFVCGVMSLRATTVILGKYKLEDMLACVEEYRVTRLPVVPPMVVQMVRSPVARNYALDSLKEVICSGAPLGREHMERFAKSYPRVILSQCYGLTETNGPITLCDGLSGRVHASIGRLVPSIEARIVDLHTRKSLPPHSFGELYIRGPSVMQGYFKNQEATSLAIDKQGWLHTGDLCFIDTCGRVYVVDRIKELIKYKAYQVIPAELEEILSTHPHVADCAIISYPNEEAGEIPMACVVRRAQSKVTEEEIINFMKNRVAPYKKIRKVAFVEFVPRSPSGKILRRHLKALTASQRLEITSRL